MMYEEKAKGQVGVVKEHYEEKAPMVKVCGGKKYSHNNAKELKEKQEKLAKTLK